MALTQIIARGALDQYLNDGATSSWWKVRYNRHTNFSCESVVQPFSTVVQFGSESQVVLNRQGDLVHYLYVQVELPGIVATQGSGMGSQFKTYMESSCAPCAAADEAAFGANGKAAWLAEQHQAAPDLECCLDTEDCPDTLCSEMGGVWCHWVNGIGFHLLKHVKIVVGGSTVDQLWSELLYIWEELSGKAGRRLTEMIGKRYTRTQLVCDSRQKRQLWVPLCFWFTQHSGNALSLASLQFHGVSLHVEWARLQDCIVVSGPDVEVRNAGTNNAIQNTDLKASLETTYVFLENAERERFSTVQFEVLITQHQAFYMQATTSQPRIQLNFNHPVLECFFAARRSCHERCNNWFNFSGIDSRDPILSADLLLNNQSRFGKKSGVYLRTVVPYQTHTNIPDAFCYCMSFALHPEDVTPSGSCNFSRIDHCDLLLELQPALAQEQTTIMVFARSFNVMRFREGLGGVAFAT